MCNKSRENVVVKCAAPFMCLRFSFSSLVCFFFFFATQLHSPAHFIGVIACNLPLAAIWFRSRLYRADNQRNRFLLPVMVGVVVVVVTITIVSTLSHIACNPFKASYTEQTFTTYLPGYSALEDKLLYFH